MVDHSYDEKTPSSIRVFLLDLKQSSAEEEEEDVNE